MKAKRKNAKNKQSAKPSFVSNLLRGFLYEVIVGVLLVFLTAYFVYKAEDPNSIILPASLISLYAIAFMGGALAYGINGNAPVICGSISGLALIGVLALISMITPAFPYELYSSSSNVIIHFAVLPVSILGATITGKLRAAKRGRRKARRNKA